MIEFNFKEETHYLSVDYIIDRFIDEISQNNPDYELIGYTKWKDDRQTLQFPRLAIKLEYTYEGKDNE